MGKVTHMMSQTPTERVARNVRAQLVRASMNQNDLAAKVGLTRSAVQRRLSGSITLSVDDLFRFAAALDCKASDLIAEAESVA